MGGKEEEEERWLSEGGGEDVRGEGVLSGGKVSLLAKDHLFEVF